MPLPWWVKLGAICGILALVGVVVLLFIVFNHFGTLHDYLAELTAWLEKVRAAFGPSDPVGPPPPPPPKLW